MFKIIVKAGNEDNLKKKNRILENCVFQNMFFLFNNYILQKH
jgi:hypothetical protein